MIFKCATSRSGNLKLSPGMTFVSFINCFKRFISRCGTPENVVSDNFKSFKSNKTEIYLKEINVTWQPILEKSSWFLRTTYINIEIDFTKKMKCRIT